jgi:Uma2 family endonuclease
MTMSMQTSAYLEAVDHLPPGAMLVFLHVRWEDYESLLKELPDRPGVHVSYDEGRLEIMSPLPEHEEYKDSLYSLARLFSELRGIELETRGSTTWKRSSIRKGSEPDCCFYVANASRIIGRREIDLESGDPPPDVVVEIDTTNESLSKFGIYSALGVPEIWRYDGRTTYMYRLEDGSYAETPESPSCPGLSTAIVGEFMDLSKRAGQTKALAVFRKRLRAHR